MITDELVQLFHDFQWVYDHKMVEILFDKNLQKIPVEISQFFANVQGFTEEDKKVMYETLLHHQSQECKDVWPDLLKNFIRQCDKLSQLSTRTTTVDESAPSGSLLDPKSIPRKWSRKKFEEVQYLAQFVGEASQNSKSDLIIDLGSGLGYLSTHLAETYQIPILAIESQKDRTESAQLVSSKGKNRKYCPENNISGFVSHVNLELTSKIVEEVSPLVQDRYNICITGLHACGDLTAWSLQLFLSDVRFQTLAIVPCCYHKMRMSKDSSCNFPLSNNLKRLLLEKCNNQTDFLQNGYFLRLASQCLGTNFLSDITNETKFTFYRALLEYYKDKENLSLKKMKRTCINVKKLETFDDYLVKTIGSEGSLNLGEGEGQFEFHRQKLQGVYIEKRSALPLITGLIAMQGALQQLAEYLVFADRLEYLRESGKVGLASVKRVIPPRVSPRGCLIYATKN